jgi:triacylglycerol esterase/lipase EstA (alpha/beta hydrolase family)
MSIEACVAVQSVNEGLRNYRARAIAFHCHAMGLPTSCISGRGGGYGDYGGLNQGLDFILDHC